MNAATTVTDLDGSATLGKFIFCTSAGVTVTNSPIVSSTAAENSCMPARQLAVSGNSIFVPYCAPKAGPTLGLVPLSPGPCMLVPSFPLLKLIVLIACICSSA
jgi:hypothetical protein